MWVISYTKRRSRHVLAEYLTINRQMLLLAQSTYCESNAKSQLFVINADYVLRE
ncbi:hypothetical protein HMPREF1579_00564 [Gardnerella vaginalis JCP8066]|nr:hypothetical protein HMPREF1579_00564 [Gardnerella vaginalis JCP8066]